MEHIIQFGVTIDEDKIVQHATDRAAREIINNVEGEINAYTRGYHDTKLERLFREEIKKTIDANKEAIIGRAVDRLAANLARTKAVKDIIAQMEVE